jgi:hypothetical protein
MIKVPRHLRNCLARSPARRGRLRGKGGFLLLEALVGVALMAFILSTLPAGIVVSRKTVQKSADTVGGRLVADAVLTNEFSSLDTLTPGARNGVLDGYQWAAMVRPRTDLQRAYKAKGWVPYDVTVSVEVPNGPRLTVETIRLGRGR